MQNVVYYESRTWFWKRRMSWTNESKPNREGGLFNTDSVQEGDSRFRIKDQVGRQEEEGTGAFVIIGEQMAGFTTIIGSLHSFRGGS